MKTNAKVFLMVAAILAQFGVGCSTWVAYYALGRNWNEILGGAIPSLTVFSLGLMRWVPLVFGLLTVAGFVIPALKSKLPLWLVSVLIAEVLVLAFLIFGLCYPALSITYRIK